MEEDEDTNEPMEVCASESSKDLTDAVINPVAMDEESSVHAAGALTNPVALVLNSHGLDGVGVEPVKPFSLPSALRGLPRPALPPNREAIVPPINPTTVSSVSACNKRTPPQLLVVRRYCSSFLSFISFLLQFNDRPPSSSSFFFTIVPRRSVCHQRRSCMNPPCLQSRRSLRVPWKTACWSNEVAAFIVTVQ